MFSKTEKLKAFAGLWNFVTKGQPATVKEAYWAWEEWARAGIGVAHMSYGSLAKRVREARQHLYLFSDEGKPKRYRVSLL